MANSPLDFFRRHKVLVMGTMLLSMVLFILGGSLGEIFTGQYFSGGRRPTVNGVPSIDPNEVVLTWTGGEVTEREMQQMRQAHHMVATYLQEVKRETIEKKATPRGVEVPLGSDEDTVVETLLLAEKAKQLGVEISDETLKTYLHDLSGYALSGKELTDIANKVTGQRFSVQQLLDQLRHELLAQHVRVMLQSEIVSGAVSLPEAWDYFNRLNRRVSIEAYPLQVSDYLDKVSGSPTEAEKQDMFDKYKFNSPDPQTPEPGFYRPAKMAFDYLKVDFAPFLDKAKAGISDEQVKTEYELRVERGEYKVPVEEKKATEKPEDTEKGADEKKDVEGESKVGEDKPATDDKAAEKPLEDAAKPVEEKPATTAEEPAEPTDDEQTTGPAACFQEETAAEETKPATEVAPATDAPATDSPATDKPATETPPATEEKPAAVPAADGKPADVPATDTKPAEGEENPATPDGKPTEEKKPEMRVQTLDEVKDEIRTTLARPIANEARGAALKAALEEIAEYGEKYYSHVEKKKADDKLADLPKLDVEALGKKHGFQTGSTPLVNRYEVSQYEIGKDGVFYRDPRTVRSFRDMVVKFPDLAFESRLAEFEPQQVASSENMDLNYVFWVTEVKPPEQPLFSDKDVQDAMLAAWKKTKAVELAKKAAEDLATKAERAKSLEEVVPATDKVLTPSPFSWFSFGSLPFGGGQAPELSNVEGIELVGEEFMAPVTRAGVGDGVVGVNYPQTIVYVVKVLAQEPSDEVLRNNFYESGMSQQVKMLARGSVSQNYFRKMQEIVKEYSLKWNRAPEAGENS